MHNYNFNRLYAHSRTISYYGEAQHYELKIGGKITLVTKICPKAFSPEFFTSRMNKGVRVKYYFSLWIKIIKLTVFEHFPFKVGLSFCSINLIALNLNQFQFTLPSFVILLNSLVFIAFKLYCYIFKSWFNMTNCHHCQAVLNKKFGSMFHKLNWNMTTHLLDT